VVYNKTAVVGETAAAAGTAVVLKNLLFYGTAVVKVVAEDLVFGKCYENVFEHEFIIGDVETSDLGFRVGCDGTWLWTRNYVANNKIECVEICGVDNAAEFGRTGHELNTGWKLKIIGFFAIGIEIISFDMGRNTAIIFDDYEKLLSVRW